MLALLVPVAAWAQQAEDAPPQHAAAAHGAGTASDDDLAWLDARAASGTSWQPEASPTWAWHLESGGKTTVVHGLAFLDAISEGGRRGDDDIGASGWVMVTQRWRKRAGRLAWRGMFTPEAAAWGERGYPELFQIGEVVDGMPLIDRQHPHDLFMELALLWEGRCGSRGAWHAYVAPAGEPALGPPAFPHRVSAAEMPQAPLGHHQEDSTHIAFGVATFGYSSRRIRVEASVFNGREPDQQRWDFDFGPLDSYSARISVDIARNWSLQASAGHLTDPDEMMPGMDAKRMTMSLQHARSLRNGWVGTSVIWGRNQHEGEEAEDALTIETTFNHARNTACLRAERVERSELPGLMMGETVTVGALTLGYVRDLAIARTGQWAIGANVTLHDVPSELEPEYGSSPTSYHVFGRWRPRRVMSEMSDDAAAH